MLRSTGRILRQHHGVTTFHRHSNVSQPSQMGIPAMATSLEQRRTFIPGPLVRVIAQMAVAAAGVVTRAFVAAYQDAASGMVV